MPRSLSVACPVRHERQITDERLARSGYGVHYKSRPRYRELNRNHHVGKILLQGGRVHATRQLTDHLRVYQNGPPMFVHRYPLTIDDRTHQSALNPFVADLRQRLLADEIDVLLKVVAEGGTPTRALICSHDNPDPDSIASGFALGRLLETKLGIRLVVFSAESCEPTFDEIILLIQ